MLTGFNALYSTNRAARPFTKGCSCSVAAMAGSMLFVQTTANWPGSSAICRPNGQAMLEKQQSDGVDAHSLAVDPLFVDPANGDFRLRPNSPALKLGFVPFDLSKVGLRTTEH